MPLRKKGSRNLIHYTIPPWTQLSNSHTKLRWCTYLHNHTHTQKKNFFVHSCHKLDGVFSAHKGVLHWLEKNCDCSPSTSTWRQPHFVVTHNTHKRLHSHTRSTFRKLWPNCEKIHCSKKQEVVTSCIKLENTSVILTLKIHFKPAISGYY